MRHLLLLLAVGCSSAKPAESTTTPVATETTTPIAGSDAPRETSSVPPVTDLGSTPASKPGATNAPASQPVTSPSQVGAKKGLYSCFSYVAANTTTKRHNCMRTKDCPDLLEQAKALKGIRELTGCASVDSVWCFHQVVKGDPEGVDVCQPTQADCTAARGAAVKAKESVDTDCAQR